MKKVIGLIGSRGAGKGTFLEEAKKVLQRPFDTVRVSDILYVTLSAWDIPSTTDNLQKVAHAMKSTFGDDAIAKIALKKINDSSSDVVFVDGVRGPHIEKVVRSFPNSVFVYINATPEVCYQRLLKRKEKAEEEMLSYEEFKKLESFPSEQQLDVIGKKADHLIENNADLETFRRAVKEYLTSLGLGAIS